MKKLLIVLVIMSFLSAFVNAQIVINEIMYNPAGDDNVHEWIEIYNNGDEDIDLDGWRFFENNENHRLNLIQGEDMTISPGEYIVIANDAETFLQDYENYEGRVLDSVFNLNNNGEYIAMRAPDGELVDEVSYLAEWGDDEEGFSLELINPNLDNNISESWGSSHEEGGTPGEQNSIFAEQELFTHEIELSQGWNLISSYLIPINFNIEIIFNELVEEETLIIAKDEMGRFFVPGLFNNIPRWNPQEAYYVKVTQNTALTIEGREFVSHEIQLGRGWNYIAYPLDEAHDMEEIIEHVLDPLGDNLIIIKNDEGRFYYPEAEFNNIPEMRPGEGFIIKVREDSVLDFSQIG